MGQPRIVQDMVEISNHISKNISKSAEDNTQLFGEAYLDIRVMQAIANKLKEDEHIDTTKVLEEAIWDMFSSIYLSASGLYRSSFMALRSALELGLAYVYFYDNNYNYLLWKNNKFDLNWSSIKEESKGIISKQYILFFCESLGEEKANKICDETKEIYRICSEYVHGKYAFMHTVDVKQVEYAQEELRIYSGIFTRVARIITTLLILRFGLASFDEDVNEQIKELLSDYPEVLYDHS
jgi:hypothetical protein